MHTDACQPALSTPHATSCVHGPDSSVCWPFALCVLPGVLNGGVVCARLPLLSRQPDSAVFQGALCSQVAGLFGVNSPWASLNVS